MNTNPFDTYYNTLNTDEIGEDTNTDEMGEDTNTGDIGDSDDSCSDYSNDTEEVIPIIKKKRPYRAPSKKSLEALARGRETRYELNREKRLIKQEQQIERQQKINDKILNMARIIVLRERREEKALDSIKITKQDEADLHKFQNQKTSQVRRPDPIPTPIQYKFM